MRTVVVTELVHPDGVSLLRARDDVELVLAAEMDEAERRAALGAAHAIGVRTLRLDADLLASARELRVVAKHGVGCDNIAVDHLTARGIPVAITVDANTVSVAEHALALMLAAARGLPARDAATRRGDWGGGRRSAALELDGRTLLLVGYGRIGRRLGVYARALGMTVLAHDAMPVAPGEGVASAPDLDAALPGADVVSLHLPLTPATAGLLDARRLGLMKPGAILVNCARGGLVDEAALAAALEAGRLAGAGIDVFAHEPPPDGHPLQGAPNCVLTPHSGAMSDAAARGMSVAMARNILAALDGRLDPGAVVNRAALDARSVA